MAKPNILFLISHDTGRYFGCYGQKVKTPEVDRLAEKGVRFDEYYCPAPQCSPSRGSIITGKYPHNNGLIGLAHLGFSIDEGVTTLPQEMGKAGYDPVLIGFNHEKIGNESSPHALGYERFESVSGNAAEDVAERTEAFLKEKASSSSKPFYASVGFRETHRPFDGYEADPDISTPAYLPDTPKIREDIAQFHGSVKTLDHAVGRIIRALEETGLEDNTLLIYTTDHGIAFPRAKGTLTDSGLETALIMRWPQGFQGGQVKSELLCNVDMMPTLLDIAGADIPTGLDGQSFLPLLKGESVPLREDFFCELTWHDRYHPMRGIRTHRYKYIHNLEAGPSVYLPIDIHKGLSGQEMRDKFYVHNVPEELYDLKSDPLEQHNLVEDDRYVDVLQELRSRVNQWRKESDDPLLKGKVPGEESPGWETEKEQGNTWESMNP